MPIQVGRVVLFQAIPTLLGQPSSLLFEVECALKVPTSCQCSGNDFVEKGLSLSASASDIRSILKYSSLVFCCIVFKITFAVRKVNFSNLLFKKNGVKCKNSVSETFQRDMCPQVGSGRL